MIKLTHHAECRIGPRDDDVIGSDKTLGEADRAAGFDHVWLDGKPLPDLRGADEIHREPHRRQKRCPAHLMRATVSHRIVGERRNQPAVNQPVGIGMGLGQPQPDDHGFVGAL